MQDNFAITFILIGLLLLLSLAANWLGAATRLPRVTTLLLLGFVIGPTGFDLFEGNHQIWLEMFSALALSMVGFLLGGRLTAAFLRTQEKVILTLSLGVALATLIIVFLGLILINLPWYIALVLAAIATATDPAATVDVIKESGSNNRFSENLLSIVTLDDIWGLVIFSMCLAISVAANGNGDETSPIIHGLTEIGTATLLGLALGIPMAFLTGRLQPGEPTLVEAIGLILLCSGLAIWLETSYLLASMVMGITVRNIAFHHRRPFHAIEGIEWPFIALFFIFAGASLEISSLPSIGAAGAVYLLCRTIGKVAGGAVVGRLTGLPLREGFYYGTAMLPQAGVAMGMALIAAHYFAPQADLIMSLAIGGTVIFELLGPICTKWAFKKQQAEIS